MQFNFTSALVAILFATSVAASPAPNPEPQVTQCSFGLGSPCFGTGTSAPLCCQVGTCIKGVSLIHGISTPSILFKDLADELVEAGFQLLLYDVYGRGYSEAPTDVLSNNDYITQLALLLQYVGWKSTYVVGMSMGGGIAAAFTSAFPHLVNGKIVLLASAGLVAGRKLGGFEKKRHESKKDGANQVSNDADPEGTPSTLVNSTGSGPSVKLGPGADSQLRKLLASSLPGLKRIIKDTRRFGPVAGLEKAFESLATVQTAGGSLRVLVIHGTKDLVVPYTEAAKAKEITYIKEMSAKDVRLKANMRAVQGDLAAILAVNFKRMEQIAPFS
ncbi:hypothetical protein EUX98_g5649 [Antrodiella citrinella]|uniref:AB hydrolase-1 domain-containing protein n=1 Tax=Antrodiella citrinella TaxID=2447956 RepID=A0A4S4MSV6_9APHY|nr:hypothetical protein EUX98_g5649 [Antrodiella citrinella]